MIIGWFSDYGLLDLDYWFYEVYLVINFLVLYYFGYGDIILCIDIVDMQGYIVIFIDGGCVDYDLILFVIGYKLDYFFIDSSLFNWQGDVLCLYLNVFYLDYDILFMMGMIEVVGLGWEGCNEQVELVVLYLKCCVEGYVVVMWLENIKCECVGEFLDGGYCYLKLLCMVYYVYKDSYWVEVVCQCWVL